MVKNMTSRFGRSILSSAILAGMCIAAGGCGSSGGSTTPTVALKLTTSTALGNYLTTGDGKTLYYYSKDVPGAGARVAVSNCLGGCLAAWPVYHFDGTPTVEGINASDVADFTRTDGTKQSTYQGWPLYYFASDSSAGDTKGEGVDNIWFVLKSPAYTNLIMDNATAGIYLADSAGRTLYMYSRDTVGTASAAPVSACTSATCLSNWPVFLASSTVVPGVLASASFTSFMRTDGVQQSAFKGHPLYYYTADGAPGDTKGKGVGGVWDTIDPTAP
jgi:predicted lipoprotein with Yx(FWY)xxD motif